MNVQVALPPRLAEIVDDFSLAEGREKLEMLLQYSDSLPAIPDWLKGKENEMETVPECMTPVLVAAEVKDGGMVFHFVVPPESPTTRGYAAILAEGLQGATPEAVLNIPPDFFLQMGLHQVLTSQRLNGMAALVAHVKRLALEHVK